MKVLTSICPGIVTFMFKTLQIYATDPSLIPLNKIYFPWKFNKNIFSGDMPVVENINGEHSVKDVKTEETPPVVLNVY